MNTVALIGRLVDNPTAGTSERGVDWCRILLRVGGRRDRNVQVTVIVFGAAAANCRRWLRTGRLVAVTGRLDHDHHHDGHCVIAHTVDFLDAPPADPDHPEAQQEAGDHTEAADADGSGAAEP